MFDIPNNLKYTKNHVWLENIGEDAYRVGITDFAQDELGDIVNVETQEEASEYSQSDECSVDESVKSASDIYCPLSGVVTEVNSELEDKPELINSDPYSDGWLFVLKANDNSELGELIDANSYYELIKED